MIIKTVGILVKRWFDIEHASVSLKSCPNKKSAKRVSDFYSDRDY